MVATRRGLAAVFAILVSVILLGCASTPAEGSGFPVDPAIERGSLENGLSWFVRQNREPANRIVFRLVVRAGSVDEDDDQRGVAHLVEHMAFNGSEHFRKNELIDYFESIGMNFGPEVNAYTSFQETVYKLEIPANEPGALDKALLVLADWAGGLSFDPEELEKERGVVLEEWRLSRGPEGRLRDKHLPVLFADSPFAKRLPIGDPEIVKTVSRERVVDFYRRWYRPDLMSVIVVGDCDAAEVRSKIEAAFAPLARAPEAVADRNPVVPPGRAPRVSLATDPELDYTALELYQAFPAKPVSSERDFRARLAREMGLAAFNLRLAEKALEASPLIVDAEAGNYRPLAGNEVSFLYVAPSLGNAVTAFRMALDELERVRRFGITDRELARARDSVLAQIERLYLEREKRHSAAFADEIVSHVTRGALLLSIDERYRLVSSIAPAITRQEVSREVSALFSARGEVLLASTGTDSGELPDEATLAAEWRDHRPKKALAPYVDSPADRPLVSDPPARGSIVSEGREPRTGIRRLVLSNGATVLYLPTDFKDDQIIFRAVSLGGSSLVADADFPSARVALDYLALSGLGDFSAVDLQRRLAGKSVELKPILDEAYEGFIGSSSVKDLKTLVELAYLHFAAPRFSGDAWGSLVTRLRAEVNARDKNPDQMFVDLVERLSSGGHPRAEPLSSALIARMDSARAERVYRDRFADPGDFTFIFVGAIPEDELRSLCEQYLSFKPATRATGERPRDIKKDFPAGISEEILAMGIESRANVYLGFGGRVATERWEAELADALFLIANIRLREVIREGLGGTYGADAWGYVSQIPYPSYRASVQFGCEPTRVDELTSAVFRELAWLRDGDIGDEYLVKAREAFRKSLETGMRNNGYWAWYMTRNVVRGHPLDEIADLGAVEGMMTAAKMRELARKYFRASNYVKASLVPEASAVMP